jgi:hypothetical protein
MEAALIGLLGGALTLIIGGLVLINWRVGNIEGRLNNGDYLRCPFYKRKTGDPDKNGGKCDE